MLIRIVKMSFRPEEVDNFLQIFSEIKHKIIARKGCTKLDLYQDKDNTNIFFTYSFWNSKADLEDYRNSELFISVWAKTKVLFNDKPEAWSVKEVDSV
ncbi:MAG: antibiotic biosynthesis monooxygenase [Flavobacteriales bacterium]|nr:MAG: antibiotic biosynthesis monooxygenase [Flavobacteriales bacterium]